MPIQSWVARLTLQTGKPCSHIAQGYTNKVIYSVDQCQKYVQEYQWYPCHVDHGFPVAGFGAMAEIIKTGTSKLRPYWGSKNIRHGKLTKTKKKIYIYIGCFPKRTSSGTFHFCPITKTLKKQVCQHFVAHHLFAVVPVSPHRWPRWLRRRRVRLCRAGAVHWAIVKLCLAQHDQPRV